MKQYNYINSRSIKKEFIVVISELQVIQKPLEVIMSICETAGYYSFETFNASYLQMMSAAENEISLMRFYLL